MPIATRYVEPRSVCSDPLLTEEGTRAGDALQAVAVRSMAGLIRQLGSLARHAESVMGELAESLASCHARTLDLEKRTRALTVQVLPGLDPDREGNPTLCVCFWGRVSYRRHSMVGSVYYRLLCLARAAVVVYCHLATKGRSAFFGRRTWLALTLSCVM